MYFCVPFQTMEKYIVYLVKEFIINKYLHYLLVTMRGSLRQRKLQSMLTTNDFFKIPKIKKLSLTQFKSTHKLDPLGQLSLKLGYLMQGLLELLWTVYSEEELQSCLKFKIFETPFNKGKSEIRNTIHKKGLKFAPAVELAKLIFTYITVVK